MGIGDEIIASGQALKMFESDPAHRRVLIVDKANNARPFWTVWEGLPWLAHPVRDKYPKDNLQILRNAPGCRPYADYNKGFNRRIGMNYTGWRVRDYRGFIQLTDAEMKFAYEATKPLGKFTIIEPLVKRQANPNKQWPRHKWQELADVLIHEGVNPVQIGGTDIQRLDRVPHIVTPSFRIGCAVMKFARWSFLPDGGLHHAAAVLGLPATVVWGGVNDPEILGYPEHENIYFPGACLRWQPCGHCRFIWNWLSGEYIWERTQQAMRNRYGEDYRSR